MLRIICLKGLPASGKSTWVKKLQEQEPGKWKRLNKDLIREMLDGGGFSHKNEEFVNSVQEQILRAALKKGFNIIYDNTSFSAKIYKRLCEIATECGGDIEIEEKIFNLDIETCIERDLKREGRAKVGEKVIRDMYNRYQLKNGYPEPKKIIINKINSFENNYIEQDIALNKAIVSDIDGTILNFCDRSAFDVALSINDAPNCAVLACLQTMYNSGRDILFLTGRNEKFRDITEEWINKHLPIPYKLYMRADDDKRPDTIYKKEVIDNHIFGKFFIEAILDDRPRICRMFREMGFVVFQLNHKEF